MKKIFLSAFVSFFLLCSVLPVQAQQRTAYGEGAYGSGEYNGSIITEVVNNIGNAIGNILGQTSAPPACDKLQPGLNPPTIYAAIPKGPHAIQIYLSPPSEPFDHYVLRYGVESTDLKWGISSLPKDTGAYTIEFLSPNTTYHFQVRGGNGCATGNWSNIMTSKTLGFYNSNTLVSDNVSVTYKKITPTPAADGITEEENREIEEAKKSAKPEEEQTYVVTIKVTGEDGKPLSGATVYIPKETTPTKTNRDGIATLEGVKKGNKNIVVEYEDYKGEQQVAVLGDSDEIEVKTNVRKEDSVFSPVFLIPIFVLLIAGAFYFFGQRPRKRKS